MTEDAVTKRSDKLWRHVLGDAKFEEIYNDKDELYDVELAKTRDLKYLLLQSEAKDTSETRYLRADQPAGTFAVFLPREKGHRYYVDHREGLFYIRTNKTRPQFRRHDRAGERPGPEKLEGVCRAARQHAHPGYRSVQGLRRIGGEEAMRWTICASTISKPAAWKEITYPEPVYSASPSDTPDFESRTYRYNYQSFVTPSSVFDYEVATGKSTLQKQQEVLGGYDPKQYVSERLWATARDGVKVPISIVYKKGFPRDGKGPLFLYGYGSYGIGMPATFSSNRISLLDRGMAYAIAHIRGGDEMGEKWREDGMLMKKKNTFFDFIDSAEFLIQQKWTSKDRLVIEGGSAGGLSDGRGGQLAARTFSKPCTPRFPLST